MPHRMWKHECAETGETERRASPFGCSRCGTISEEDGWDRSLVEKMASYNRLYRLPAIGPHRSMTDELYVPLTETCTACRARGVRGTDGGSGWEECPACHGTGRVFVASDIEVEAVREEILAAYPELLRLDWIREGRRVQRPATRKGSGAKNENEHPRRSSPSAGIADVDDAIQSVFDHDSATSSVSRDRRDPWANVLPTALGTKLDQGLGESGKRNLSGMLFTPKGDPTIRAALSAVVDADALEAEYLGEPWWHHLTPMEVLDHLPGVEARPVITCWVSDSMVSGEWSLNEVHVGNRGYVFYVPDFGIGDREDLPLLGAWEPVDNTALRRTCLLEIYLRQWQDQVYPPSFGQWAKGDVEILLGGMEGVLEQHPEAWNQVGEWIDTYVGSRITLEDEDLLSISQMVAQPLERVRKVVNGLSRGWTEGCPSRDDAEVVIGLVAHCLGKGPY